MNENPNGSDSTQLAQNILFVAQAIGEQTKVLSASFPQSGVVSGSAGAASGQYLTIVAADGTPYKIALLLP